MMRQSSSRNQRTKGMRTKSIIQMCLLTAVSFWLLYQLKHSYDKRRLLGDRSSRKLNDVVDSHAEFIKLGRKDLPQSELIQSASDANIKDEEKEEVEEDEDAELRREMEAVEREQLGDDDIDEQDHERDEDQEDQEMGNDESETGEDTGNEEDKDDQVEEVQVLDDHEHVKDSSHEAREKSYKKDDASSAVHRENLEAKTGNEIAGLQSETNAVKTKGKGTEREDTTILKDDAAKDSSGSGVVDPTLENNTISNSINITGNAFETRQIEENEKELNTTALLVSVNQEKLNVESSAHFRSNQTAAAPFNLSDLGEGINNHTPIHNPYVKSNPIVDNNVVPEKRTQENNRPTLDTVAEEPAHKSNITIEHENSKDRSTASLAPRKTEPNAPAEPAADFSHQITTEGEKEGHADISNLSKLESQASKMVTLHNDI